MATMAMVWRMQRLLTAKLLLLLMVSKRRGGVAAQSATVETEFVDAHNAARAAVGVAGLTWNTTLADYAQAYATSEDSASRGCGGYLTHSAGPYGENLYWSWNSGGSAATPADAVTSWTNESQYYDYASNTCAQDKDCGHYTQVVWADTTQLGCYLLSCISVPGATYVICSYAPPGNVVDQWPY